MDTFVCSSWYFLRFLDPHNKDFFCSRKNANAWLPIDQYIGGIEHATGHLIYFRFFTKVLYDAGYISVDEPTKNLFTQGMVLRNGEVMSKSKGNAVPVGPFVEGHGADVARITILFAAPPEKDMEWSDKGVTGAERFLDRIYRIVTENKDLIIQEAPEFANLSESDKRLYIKINQTIAKVNSDLESFKFNTAIAALWELLNALYATEDKTEVFGYGLFTVMNLLSPFAPHLADELWSFIDQRESIMKAVWPQCDTKHLGGKSYVVVIQINGRVRSHIEIDREITEEEIKRLAFQDRKVRRWLGDKEAKRVIYVPKKIVNIVA
jgi:leucyl-tRNA synthetase